MAWGKRSGLDVVMARSGHSDVRGLWVQHDVDGHG